MPRLHGSGGSQQRNAFVGGARRWARPAAERPEQGFEEFVGLPAETIRVGAGAEPLARLTAADRSSIGQDTRLVGSFRAHALLVPVWELPVGTGAEALEEPAAAFTDRLVDALGSEAPLTSAQRAARAGLATRQVTIR